MNDRPLIKYKMRVTVVNPIFWRYKGTEIHLPIGIGATIVMRFCKQRGIGLDVDGMRHPDEGSFPMSETFVDRPLPARLELESMEKYWRRSEKSN